MSPEQQAERALRETAERLEGAQAYRERSPAEAAADARWAPGEARWSRHWGGSDTFDERCSECRQLGAACGTPESRRRERTDSTPTEGAQ